jgi:NTE family protein
MKKYKIGVALGGGGARGFAHLGVLKALEEKGIQPDVISGVSAGALVGVFIAAGQKPDDVFEMMKKNKFHNYAQVIVPNSGLLSLEKTGKMLEKHLSAKTFDDLKIPLFVAATNLLEGKIEYFNSGKLPVIIQASMSIPVLFAPVKIGKGLYADGGIMDNLPVEPLLGKCRRIIAVNISPLQTIARVHNLIDAATRAFHLSVSATIKGIEEKCDLFIEPGELVNCDLFDTSNVDEMFEIGYEYTKQLSINF